MKETIYYTSLFDIYGQLLTVKQQEYFKLYYFENLLLDEISDNNKVSKNAISKEVKRAKELLEYYEEKLRFYKLNKNLHLEFANEPDILERIEKIM